MCNEDLEPQTKDFYVRTMKLLMAHEIPFLVGGAYAFARYTGIERHTKDFDIFVRKDDCARILSLLASYGYHTELTYPHWLGKAYQGDDFIDVIFSSGNCVAEVDALWFEHAVDDKVFQVPVKLCPAEEIIWSKSFVMERERYDGADVAHLLRATARELDWRRLLERFGAYWRVLLSNFVLFGFIYPRERNLIPGWVMQELLQRLQFELTSVASSERVCQGTLISREQYRVDVDRWSYRDARLCPHGKMTQADIDHWTASIGNGK